MQKTLSDNPIEKEIKKLEHELDTIARRRGQLVEKLLNGVIEDEVYKEMDHSHLAGAAERKKRLEELRTQQEEENSTIHRINEFKELFEEGNILPEFDRQMFESIIDRVIVGGYNEEREPDPYRIIFIFKTGFTKEVCGAKGKNRTQKNTGSSIREKL